MCFAVAWRLMLAAGLPALETRPLLQDSLPAAARTRHGATGDSWREMDEPFHRRTEYNPQAQEGSEVLDTPAVPSGQAVEGGAAERATLEAVASSQASESKDWAEELDW